MFSRGISRKTKNSLALLSKISALKKFYLAGGTAIALHLGHRLSFDLDFFTSREFQQKELIRLMQSKGIFILDQIKKNTLLGIFENIKVSFFKYDYPLISKIDYFYDIKIASREDLMAMKIDAIATRGKKRDFIDLYFLSQKNSLQKAFNCYKKKYKGVNLFHALKALNFFEDAEEEEGKLYMLVDYDWTEVKKYFLEKVPKILDHELGVGTKQ